MRWNQFKKPLILSMLIILLIAFFGCYIRIKGEQEAINDYGMFMSSQYNILNVLQESLDVNNDRSDFVNKFIFG